MRRWMIVLAIAGLFVALVAAPGAAKKQASPEMPVLEGSGVTTFEAIEVWTGDPAGNIYPKGPIQGVPGWYALMDPKYNRCEVRVATLTWDPVKKNTAVLHTEEWCPLFGPWMPRLHDRVAHITLGGAVKLAADTEPFFPNDPETGDHWLAKASGCGLNGTFPVYHGAYDFETGHLYAETHFHGICDGGTRWGAFFGIGKEDGPLHATFSIDLSFAVDD